MLHGHIAGLLPDGRRAGTAASDAEVDSVEEVGNCDVSVRCHPCYLGGSKDTCWCTTYHRTDQVLVIRGAA